MQVFAVSKKDTKAVYACKTLSKDKVCEKKREKLIKNERDILAAVNNPFIIGLKYAFQDDAALYLVIDLMTGGELQFHLNRYSFFLSPSRHEGAHANSPLHRYGSFSEELVRFYAAGIVLALEYLHSKGIVYRCVCQRSSLCFIIFRCTDTPAPSANSDLKPENVMIDGEGANPASHLLPPPPSFSLSF